MSIQNKLNDLKNQKSYSIPAKRVMEHLKPILSNSQNLSKRWMWELLQNASDLGTNIKTKFEITNKTVTFSHNGKPFSLDEAYNLIMPDSNKDDLQSSKKSIIGQFGTGFISTHILSKIISVAGIVEDENDFYSFSFDLDRTERTNKDELIKSIQDSEEEYKSSLTKIRSLPDEEFQTTFTYKINKTYPALDGAEVVNEGLGNFYDLLPLVLAFRSSLIEIQVIDNRTDSIDWLFQSEGVPTEIKGLQITKTVCYKNDEHYNNYLIGHITEQETTIAFQLSQFKDDIYKLLPFPENCPKLFCAFPMIGLTEVNFPVVIHSEKFTPNRERDGIEITKYDEDNRTRLVEAKDAYIKLLNIIEEYEWIHAYNVCSLITTDIADIQSKTWFTNTILNPLKDVLYQTKLIELSREFKFDEYRDSLNHIYVPYADKRLKNNIDVVKSIFKFIYTTLPGLVPAKNQYLRWYEILDFDLFGKEKLDLKKLCEVVTDKISNLTTFSKEYGLNEDESIAYLVELVEFILKMDKKELLNEYPLLLNQNNDLVKLKGLKWDNVYHKSLQGGYDEKLKDVYKSLSNSDCRNELLHRSFENIGSLIDEDDQLEFAELIKDIDEELRNYNGNFQDSGFLLTLKELFNWYTTCGISEETLSKHFPYFAANKSQLYLNTKTPEELEYAFDIEISGKSKELAKLANSKLSQSELNIIAKNPALVSSFMKWLNNKEKDNPDEELGNIGEEFLYHTLCDIFDKERVLWENKPEYDFRILEKDKQTTKYYIDAKTTGKGIANTDNVPFFIRMAQWNFLDKQQVFDKYIIARIFKNGDRYMVKYLKLNPQKF